MKFGFAGVAVTFVSDDSLAVDTLLARGVDLERCCTHTVAADMFTDLLVFDDDGLDDADSGAGGGMPGCDISEMLLMSSPENDQEPKTVGDRTACEVISVQFILNFTRAEAPCEQAGPRAWARFTHQESD